MEIDTYQETCASANCGLTFWVTKEYHNRRCNDKTSFYCPNGHGQQYNGKTDAQIVREKEVEIKRLTLLLAQKPRRGRPRKTV